MTAEEFEKQYIERSNMTKEIYDQYFVTLPCNCIYDDCPKWAVVPNSESSIRVHKQLYGIE